MIDKRPRRVMAGRRKRGEKRKEGGEQYTVAVVAGWRNKIWDCEFLREVAGEREKKKMGFCVRCSYKVNGLGEKDLN